MPVPARRTSVIVAKESQVSRSRACSELNRSAMTSCALRARSASYAASAVEDGRVEPAGVPPRVRPGQAALPVGEQPQVGLAVRGVQAGQLGGGRVAVAGHDDRVAVGQGQDDGRIGVDVAQAVLGQPQLVVPDDRVGLDQHVRAGAGVVPEARQRELLGHGVAADVRLLLEDDDLEPGRGEVGRPDQAVVAGADDDDVRAVCAHPARTSPLGKPCRRSAPSSVTSSSSPVCTPSRPSGVATFGWTTTVMPASRRQVGRRPDRAAAGADDRRQVAPAEAVHEVVDGGEAGVLDDARGLDQRVRVHPGPQLGRDRVERRLGDVVQLAVPAGSARRPPPPSAAAGRSTPAPRRR